MKHDLKHIVEASIYGNLGFFIGSGFSKAMTEGQSSKALTWFELIESCFQKFELHACKIDKIQDPLKKISEIITCLQKEKSLAEEEAVTFFKQKVCEVCKWHPSQELKENMKSAFKSLEPAWIITTNYDQVIETLVDNCQSLTPSSNFICQKNLIPIYHIHGINSDHKNIVFTQEDYIKAIRPNNYQHTKLTLMLKESVVVFMGYRLNDINVLQAIDLARNYYNTSEEALPIYIVDRKKGLEGILVSQKNNIFTIECAELKDFLQYLAFEKEAYEKRLNAQLEKIKKIKNKITSSSTLNLQACKEICEEIIKITFCDEKLVNDNKFIGSVRNEIKNILDCMYESMWAKVAYGQRENEKNVLSIINFSLWAFNINTFLVTNVLFDTISKNLIDALEYLGEAHSRTISLENIEQNTLHRVVVYAQALDKQIALRALNHMFKNSQ